MSNYWIIKHPLRGRKALKPKDTSLGMGIICDNFNRNQDPYIWANNFLYSYCKINPVQIKSNIHTKLNKADYIFWVLPVYHNNKLIHLYCDLVFHIKEIVEWSHPFPDKIEKLKGTDYVDENSYNDHFRWWIDHPKTLKKNQKGEFIRITYVAEEESSFQLIKKNGNSKEVFHDLIDLLRLDDENNVLSEKIKQESLDYIKSGEVISKLKNGEELVCYFNSLQKCSQKYKANLGRDFKKLRTKEKLNWSGSKTYEETLDQDKVIKRIKGAKSMIKDKR